MADLRVVVGDLHGNHEALRALLLKVGSIDNKGERVPGFHVVHVGDIINGVPESATDDGLILSLTDWFDVMIPGNHDLWWLHQHPAGRFGGLDESVSAKWLGKRGELLHSGKSTVAYALDGWLITHAGLHVAYYPHLAGGESADTLAGWLESQWRSDPKANMFSAYGPYRSGGGDPRPGGIFWCDWRELTALPSTVRQIVGHTPQPNGPVHHDNIWSVDIGAKVGPRAAALVKDAHASEWLPVTL